ncbi:unnamed protein product [Boreogadus saida]
MGALVLAVCVGPLRRELAVLSLSERVPSEGVAKAGVALGEPDEDEDDPFVDGLPGYAAGVESRRRVIASFF